MPKRVYISALVILAAIFVALAPPPLTFVTMAGFLAMWFLVRNLQFGLLVLIFFFPYLGLVVDLGQFEIFRDTVYLKNINAPFVDLFGLVLFGAWGLRRVYEFTRLRDFEIPSTRKFAISQTLPHWRSYLLFWLSGLVSLLRVPVIHFSVSLKYFARPFTFFYLVFFVPVVSILTRVYEFTRLRDFEYSQTRKLANSQTLLHRALLVFFWTGLLSAANGLLGLVFGAHDAFPRATPFGFFGINPLGPNHNLLAETLIATAPVGLILNKISKIKNKKWIDYGMWFQWIVVLLTFARTAWIAIAVQAVVYFVLGRRKTENGRRIRPLFSVFRLLRQYWAVALGVTLVVVVFLGITISSETVRGSTLSRLDMARIAFFYFERTPILGQGVGTFLPTLWQTKAYLLEYGDPIEAHGIIFKLMFEQGLFGIVAFGIFAGAILISLYRTYKTYRTDKTYSIALVAALLIAAGTLTYQLFNTTYYTSKLWVPLAIAVAIARIMNYESGIREQKTSTP